MRGLPGTKCGDATFGFSSLVLKYSDAPTFDRTLKAFACSYGSGVYVLSFLEDFFSGYRLTQKCFCVFELFWDCSATDLDFGYVRFLFG